MGLGYCYCGIVLFCTWNFAVMLCCLGYCGINNWRHLYFPSSLRERRIMIKNNLVFVGFDVGIKNFAIACEWRDELGQTHHVLKKTQIADTNELGQFLDKNFLNQPFLKNKLVLIGFEGNHWMNHNAYPVWKTLNEYNGFIKGWMYGDVRFQYYEFVNNAVKAISATMIAPTKHEKDALAIIKLLKERL